MKQPLARSDLILHRIADTLGVPPETFAQAAGHVEADPAQSTALLRAFLQISDPELRGKCVAFVEEAAASSKSRNF